MKENTQGIIPTIPIENLPPNINNFQSYNAPVPNFPVKNMEILEYPTEEKKQQAATFPPFQNDGLKSSDSSFITGNYFKILYFNSF